MIARALLALALTGCAQAASLVAANGLWAVDVPAGWSVAGDGRLERSGAVLEIRTQESPPADRTGWRAIGGSRWLQVSGAGAPDADVAAVLASARVPALESGRECTINRRVITGAAEMYALDRKVPRVTAFTPAFFQELQTLGYLQKVPTEPGHPAGPTSYTVLPEKMWWVGCKVHFPDTGSSAQYREEAEARLAALAARRAGTAADRKIDDGLAECRRRAAGGEFEACWRFATELYEMMENAGRR